MPKLNTEQLMERTQKCIHHLDLAKRLQPKTSALLNAEQQLAVALAVEVELKKSKRARTDDREASTWLEIN